MHQGRISTYIVLSKDGEPNECIEEGYPLILSSAKYGEPKECTEEGYPLTLSSAKTESPKNAPRKDIYLHCPQQRWRVQRMHQGRISTYIVLSKDGESKECTKEGYPLTLSSAKTESPMNAPRKDINLHC